jgi:nitrogen fixation NifU-like protein
MEDITLLYQGAIRDHWLHPRNYGLSPDADFVSKGDSLICGDHITLGFRLKDDRISDIRFEADACAVCLASASMMTVAVMGNGRQEARSLAQAFVEMLMTNAEHHELNNKRIVEHELAVFAAVKKMPSRTECAILPWRTLQAAFPFVKHANSPEAAPVP